MSTSLTQTDIDNMEQSLASGELQVRIGDRWITYRSVEEIERALGYAKRQISAAAGNTPARAFAVEIDRGLS